MRTGLALVHEGEVVYPAMGDEAEGTPLSDAMSPGVVEYLFPVEIEVRVAPSARDLQAIVDAALDRLAARLEGR